MFWNVGALFLTLSYMAVILGVMMIPKRPPSLDTDDKLLDAVKAGKYKAAAPSDLKMYLQNMIQSPLSRYQELGNIILEKNWILDVNRNTFNPLLRNGYGLASAIVTRKLCGSVDVEMVISEDFIYQGKLCSLLSKNFPLENRFNRIMTRMVEHGLYEREYELFIFESRLKYKQNTETEKKIG